MSTPLWQHPLMASLEDGALRPGGLQLTRTAYDKLNISSATRILDAGCGNGTTAQFLQQHYSAHVTTIDLSEQNTKQAHQKALCTVQASVDHLPFCDNAFNIVNCDCVLSLCNSVETAVAEFFRVLSTGGMLILSDLYRRAQTPSCSHAPKAAPIEHTASCSNTSGCSSNPLSLPKLFKILTNAGFTHTSSTDCTKELKELTAKLIFSGITPCCSKNSQDCSTSYDKTIGYIQINAEKKG